MLFASCLLVKSSKLLILLCWHHWSSHYDICENLSPNPNVPIYSVVVSSGPVQPWLGATTTTKLISAVFNLRHGVVEGCEGAAHHRDVHHVPEITHVSSGV